jgi:hypothetical protein
MAAPLANAGFAWIGIARSLASAKAKFRRRGGGDIPQIGTADQPVELDRGVIGRIDDPPDQIPAGTLGRGHGFGRQTRFVAIYKGVVGDEDNFPEPNDPIFLTKRNRTSPYWSHILKWVS